MSASIAEQLRSAETVTRRAKDLMRASRLPLLHKGDPHVAKDTSVQIPFSPSHDFWMTVLTVLMIGVVGGGFLLWGIVRAARGPRAVTYAY